MALNRLCEIVQCPNNPLVALPMEKGQADWSKGRGPKIRPIFPTSKAKLARVTPSTVKLATIDGFHRGDT